MLNHALNLLCYWRLRNETKTPDAPVFFTHPYLGRAFLVTIQEMPEKQQATG